ncbi:Apolipoprotein N-acyltransferase [Fulvimarina manganoxydans]|uniref:Apolipoprotein N-acyltransferase n=1 Tax=Fulvimarina manganoxydans TaxID=937218 RepID=A0A1W2DZB5_9HYPH|nr:apolipoprotein N-acyltransferase [Fulvimarina manganoxydans]SMD02436.1 Apolipoprotein N-acyltransferase [Fulvimarina manganoxydans]
MGSAERGHSAGRGARRTSLFEALAGRIMLASGWRRALLAALSGAIATLGLPPFDIPLAGFIAFPVLVWLLDGLGRDPGAGALKRFAAPFAIGWTFGFGYFVAGLWWLGAALLVDAGSFAWFLPFAVLGLPAILAIFFGLAAALARLVWSDSAWRILGLASAFALAEWGRGFVLTGFPWNEIGLIALSHPVLVQSVSLMGLQGITLLAVLIFSTPAILSDRRGRWPVAALALALVVGQIGYGIWRLDAHPPSASETVAIRIVQPNIRQSLKWNAQEAERNFEKLLELTAMRPAPGEDVVDSETPADDRRTLIVWPETAFPFVLTDRPDALNRLADTLQPGETLIGGAVRVERSEADRARFYNSIYVIDDQGTIVEAADKLHLVPFGEYLPFQDLLESWGVSNLVQMPGGFSAGASRRAVELAGAPSFLPLICYEIIFPDEITLEDPAPGFILNVTNDAWYGETPGPYQHLRMAQVTAVALGLPLIRAANTGISVVDDALGRERSGLGLGATGTIDLALPTETIDTPYRRHGALLFWGLWCVFTLLSVVFRLDLRPRID